MRVMLVSEPCEYAVYLAGWLEEAGHSVDRVRDIREGETALRTVTYCVVILMLASSPAGRALSRWRENAGVPLLAMGSAGSGAGERTAALNAGADDCVTVPVALPELLARLYALVRRNAAGQSSCLTHGDIVLDTASREVWLRGEPVKLTGREMALLEMFLLNRNRVLSERSIEDRLCSLYRTVGSNVVEVHVSRLRKKLGRQIIRTVWGQGYRLGEAITAPAGDGMTVTPEPAAD
ncbi:response regulator transcription factor [Citrobacter sp. CtB7.12]|uniref:response regulator transcription factor n=1 Tax=Citrobacter sp. CtB7.12 TaxID=1696093 RepID=UPI00092F9D5C|nr:response regulator transcription factor [Citrobacter sp. CtB7.12]